MAVRKRIAPVPHPSTIGLVHIALSDYCARHRLDRPLAHDGMKFPRLTPKHVTQASLSFTFTRRAMVLGAVQGGIGALLAGRMAWISLAENEKYSLLSESNRVNLTLIPPRRGWILD